MVCLTEHMDLSHDAPDYCSLALGFRCWLIDGEALIAPYMRTRWQPQQNTAACVEYPVSAGRCLPEPEWLIRNSGARCKCGTIHRYHTRDCVPLGYPKCRAQGLSLMPAEPPPAGMSVIAYAEHHHAPVHDCRCGLYAYHRQDPVDICPCSVCARRHDPWQVETDQCDIPQIPLLGALHAWGTIETAISGFRAEYAAPVVLAPYIEHVYTPDEYDHLLAQAARYGCPVVAQTELTATAQRYGASLSGQGHQPEDPLPTAAEIASQQLYLPLPEA